MSLLAATLTGDDHITCVATGGGRTFSISVERPIPDHLTLAFSDGDGEAAMVVRRETFDKAVAAYLGVEAA